MNLISVSSAFLVASIIILLFILWFVLNTHTKRWSNDRIGSLAASTLINNITYNPLINNDTGKHTYRAINAKQVNTRPDKKTSEIYFEFVDQFDKRTYHVYVFTLINHYDNTYCPVPNDKCIVV